MADNSIVTPSTMLNKGSVIPGNGTPNIPVGPPAPELPPELQDIITSMGNTSQAEADKIPNPVIAAAMGDKPPDNPTTPDVRMSSAPNPFMAGATAGKLPSQAPASPLPEPIASLASTGIDNSAANTPEKAPGFLGKLKNFFKNPGNDLKLAGALGGGLEAANNPMREPYGAEMLQRTEQAAAQRELEREKMEKVDVPLAQAHAQYFSTFNPTKLGVQEEKNTGQLQNTQLKNFGALQVAALRAGAPMMVDPQMAGLAGQPQLAGQMVSGATLQNFVRVLGARGIHIQDLGDEGLWAVTKDGQRIRQLTINSPTLQRASAYARAHAEYTPVDVYDQNGLLRSESQLDQLRNGNPKATTVFAQQGPTTQSRNMAQSANTVIPHIDELENFLQQNQGLVGPVAGRINDFLIGKIGSTGSYELDQQLGQLKGSMKLMQGALARTHFGGRSGVQAAQYFNTLMSMQTDVGGLIGILESTKPYMQGYAEMQNFTPNTGGTPPPSVPPKGNNGKAAKPKANGNPPAKTGGGFFSGIKGAQPVNGTNSGS